MHSTNHCEPATADTAPHHPADLVRIVDRVGWHGRAYVLPRQTLGDDGGEALMFQSEAQIEGGMSQRGSLDQWKARYRCRHAQRGRGRDYLQRWRATDNGIEAMASQHSDALLCLDELAQLDSAGTLARILTLAAEGTYGTPGRAWLRHLVESTDGLSATLRERMEAAEARFVPELASGQVQRVGRRFALVAVAGELATDAGLTGWPAGAATAAAHRCFNAWVEARPAGIGMTEGATQ